MIELKQFNELIEKAHKNAVDHGFYEWVVFCEREVRQRQMLIVSEIAEAMEADRKKRWLTKEATKELKDIVDGNESCDNFTEYYNLFIKGSVEEELADICIRCFDTLGFMSAELDFMDETFGHVKYKDLKIDMLTDNLWELCFFLTKTIMQQSITKVQVYLLVYYCFGWCDEHDIDLLTHIKAKMMYNANRPYKHGKSY